MQTGTALPIVVQKYGGSSVADSAHMRAIAARIQRSHHRDRGQVIVVSAMGDTTNRLLRLAAQLNVDPGHRELDLLLATGEQQSASLLSLALQQLGLKATALTGPQAGIRTCGAHLNARIDQVDGTRIRALVADGHVVVVAGFQGLSPRGELTTLGRGGSDTTAVAIAAALQAQACEIYSDVDGVYTADPRVVPEAVRLPRLSHGEMKDLAHHGARVLNERAIDCAITYRVTIHARCSKGRPGETIVRPDQGLTHSRIVGVAGHAALLQIEVLDESCMSVLRQRLAEYDPFMAKSAWRRDRRFLLPSTQFSDEAHLADTLHREFGDALRIRSDLGAVSAVGHRAGLDMSSQHYVCKQLGEAGIPVDALLASDNAICALVPRSEVRRGLQQLHARCCLADAGVAHVA
ncbi:MAG: aspartate kinase [Xanthomonadales bacterium]|nr:aspartate kinase [Xanthomonadales bacterium]